jgi:O-acetyl-ADP-ribose deacetylase (regulator of RNase III)
MSDQADNALIARRIGNASVTVRAGNLADLKVDAYVVPHFKDETSYLGVGGAVWRGGAESGMQAHSEHLEQNGPQAFGSILLVPSGGGNARYLIHTTTLHSGPEREYRVVRQAFARALKACEKNKLTSLAGPALGTGDMGRLSHEQSAMTMMNAIAQRPATAPKLMVHFVIWNNPAQLEAFRDVLMSESFRNAPDNEVGRKGIDAQKAIGNILGEMALNDYHEARKAGAKANKSGLN